MKRAVIALLLAALLCGGCASRREEPQPEFVFRYAENQAEDYPTTMAAYYFAERVYDLSEGRIRIFVYPEEALGDERSIIEQMQYGGIDFGRVNLSPLSEYDKRLFVLQMPYLYQDSAHMWRVLESEIGDAFLIALSDIGLAGLAWVDAGARNFYTQEKPIHTLADMQGLRIRVQENSVMERLVELLGAEPVQMRYSDVLAALQTGKIDGAENNFPSYQSTGHYLVAPFLVEDAHSRIPEVIVACKTTMERMTPSDQALIRAAAQEAAVYQRALWTEYEARTRAEVIESGCAVYTPPQEEREAFMEIAARLIEEFAGGQMDVIKAIASYREETTP